MATVFDALHDPQFLADVGGRLRDAGNRGVAATIGAPVDIITQALNLGIAGAGYLGHKSGLLNQPPGIIENPVLGSEWIGRKMEEQGMVSGARNPVAEFLTSLILPAGMQRAGTSLFRLENAALRNATAVPSIRGPLARQQGMINISNDRPMNVNSIDDVREVLRGRSEPIFVRWSAGPKHDMKKGASSRDYISGERHAGLSAVPLDKEMSDAQIAKFLSEYEFLRMKNPNLRPYLYTGRQVGSDSDGYPSIEPSNYVGELSDDFISALSNGLPRRIELEEKIRRAYQTLEEGKVDRIGRQIVEEGLQAAQAELRRMDGIQ